MGASMYHKMHSVFGIFELKRTGSGEVLFERSHFEPKSFWWCICPLSYFMGIQKNMGF